MEKLNLLHWVLFFNKPKFLKHILTQYVGKKLHLGRAITGDHISYIYEYKNAINEERKVTIAKLGITICIFAKSYHCFDLLLKSCNGLLSAREVLDCSIVICNEEWSQGLTTLKPYIEAAFAKMPIIKRTEYVNKWAEL